MIYIYTSNIEHKADNEIIFDACLHYDTGTCAPGGDHDMGEIVGIKYKNGVLEGIEDMLPKIDVLIELGFISDDFDLEKSILDELFPKPKSRSTNETLSCSDVEPIINEARKIFNRPTPKIFDVNIDSMGL